MTRLVIDSVEYADLTNWAGTGDDTVFVGLRAGSLTGWYGPLPAAAATAVRALAPAVLGRDACDHEGLHRTLTAAAPATAAGSWAAGAIDCAAWDLHAAADGVRVADLLAPHPAGEVPAYASWLTRELSRPGTLDLVADVATHGWAFTKWAVRALPGTTGETLAESVAVAAAAARQPVAADAVGTWPRRHTADFARHADPSTLHWIEDPAVHQADHTPLRRLPVAAGERLTLTEDPADLLARVQPAVLTLDVVGCGGLTRARDILATTTVPVYPHGRSLQPGLHLAAAHPDRVPAVEYRLQWEPGRQRLYKHPAEARPGHLALPGTTGLGATPRSSR